MTKKKKMCKHCLVEQSDNSSNEKRKKCEFFCGKPKKVKLEKENEYLGCPNDYLC